MDFNERMRLHDPDAGRKTALLDDIESMLSFLRMYGTRPITLTDLRRVHSILTATIDTGVESR